MSGQPATRLYITKEEASAPTVLLEALMLSCAIDTKDNQYIVVTDIPWAFLHMYMEGIVKIILEGDVTELIIKLEPETNKVYVWVNQKGKPMLYVQLKKALYGTLEIAI